MEPGKTIQGNVRNINRGKLEGLDEGKSWKSNKAMIIDLLQKIFKDKGIT